jgi:hypothetical protein
MFRCSSSTRVRSSVLEPDLDLARILGLGLELPRRADVTTEHHTVWRIESQESTLSAWLTAGRLTGSSAASSLSMLWSPAEAGPLACGA